MKQDIITNSYLRIPEFISRHEAHALSSQFKEYAVTSCIGDSQAPNSHSVYDFLPFLRLLVKKIPEVSFLFGEDVLPTYTYARVYKTGSVLERHRDRPACEVSITLNLSKSHDWPICFQRSDGTESSIELEPGDAALYMGCVADHWRTQFVGDEYVQVFLHYVRSHGESAWAYFDKNRDGSANIPQPMPQIEQPQKVEIKNKDWQVNIL
jgi:hypothetical protein